MYQRNALPKGLRWQMHSGGQPQRWPAGLWRRSANPTTVKFTPGGFLDRRRQLGSEGAGAGRPTL